jgi:ABC-type nitrate/sulfonate/bicarbonate transport system substrate-binding protein
MVWALTAILGVSCSSPMHSIRIGFQTIESDADIWVADELRFFNRNGLKVTIVDYDTGLAALNGMLKGEVDIAGVSEYPVVGKALQREKIEIIASHVKMDLIYLVGRKDSGIERISDLKGKKVGTLPKTIAEFYLGRFLSLNGMNMNDIALIDVKTLPESVTSLADGGVDAIVVSEPYVSQAKDVLKENAVVFSAQSYQDMYGLIVTTKEWIAKNPELVTRFVKSLALADDSLLVILTKRTLL